ncbi:MAG: response regulator [Ignavibacteriaceae bacterium]|nr:response regulator [Ignavibacteriaceae bacterium]NUM69408.1 response regulator [Ignavibacteriaceae bacterium]
MLSNNLILLVEDNPDDEALTLRALNKGDYKSDIMVLRDGQQAVDYLNAADESRLPALIMLDLKLPKLSGIDVLKFIRSNNKTKHLPVVVLTSSSEESDIRECYEYHVNSYVRKPVNMDEFTESVRNLGLYWLMINEAFPKRGF